MSVTKKICVGLAERLPEDVSILGCSPSHIEYLRTDSKDVLYHKGVEWRRHKSYLLYNESKDIIGGEVKVPTFRVREKKEGFEQLGCDVPVVVRHRVGISTIYL